MSDVDAYAIAGIAFFATDHWIAGCVCIGMAILGILTFGHRAIWLASRRAALEEAAGVCDDYPKCDPAEDGNGYWAAENCAAAIRVLKETK